MWSLSIYELPNLHSFKLQPLSVYVLFGKSYDLRHLLVGNGILQYLH